MAKHKFRRIEQQKTFTRREQYENALTPARMRNRPKQLSYVEIDIGEGETANIYFLPISAADGVKLRDPGLAVMEAVNLMIDIVAEKVVDPFTVEPLQSIDDWRKEDADFLNQVISAVTGLQFIVEGEEVEGETVEVDIDIEAIDTTAVLASDPNPLDGTAGSNSLTASTLNSAGEDEKEPVT